ncbi:MAG TPA: hypothetical protein VNM40_02310 [Candidatus Paceibacterota bacterium]|nr:hypothetical protein [Candidatus Paceibacterota bacterium]
MDLSIFLAKLFGLYFLIAGGIIMLRQKSFMPVVMDFFSSRSLIMLVGLLELVAGLALVIAMPNVTPDWRGVISLIGYWMALEGVIYLTSPYTKLHRVLRHFNTPTWYTSGGLFAVVLGAYLAGKGFGFW